MKNFFVVLCFSATLWQYYGTEGDAGSACAALVQNYNVQQR